MTIKLWQVSTGTCVNTLTGHTNWVEGVVFTPDGQTLASCSADGSIKLWRVSDGTCQTTLTNPGSAIYSMAISPDGTTLATGDCYSSGQIPSAVKLWRVSTGACTATLTGHTAWIESVAFSPNGQTVASCSMDDTVKLWQVSSGTCQATLGGEDGYVISVAFSPDGLLLASGNWDSTIKLWQVSTGTSLSTLTGHTGPLLAVDFSPDGESLASGGYDGSALWSIGVPLSAVSITPSPAAPQPATTHITITATATGGTNVQYMFWLYNPTATPAWSELQASSSSATCAWTPAATGNYLLSVTATDGLTGAQVNNMLWYAVATPLSAVSITPSPASPQPANTHITITATATGGTNVQYMFWLYNPTATPAWSELQASSSSATCTWKPAATGNYLLSVTATDGVSGAQVSNMLWYAVATPLSAVSITPSPASPQAANTNITITATATGGTNVQYMFWLYNPTATPAWSELQASSSSATCAWKPAATGNYLISVTATDGISGAQVSNMLWYAVATPLSAVSITPSPASPQAANTKITITAKATGGTNVQYMFWLYNPTATPAWSELQASSSSATCTWTPAATGNYLLSVTATDGVSGAQVSNMLWYAVATPLSAVSITPSPASPQPATTHITITAKATGGTNVQYMFWLYNRATTTWSELQASSSSATCTWTPAATGNYLLSVTATDGVSGAQVSNTLWYAVATPLERGEHHHLPGLAAGGQDHNHPHRKGDRRH